MAFIWFSSFWYISLVVLVVSHERGTQLIINISVNRGIQLNEDKKLIHSPKLLTVYYGSILG